MSSTIILITGANSGIGYACTKVLASASSPSSSYHIIMTGRSLPNLQAAHSELSTLQLPGQLSLLQLDITSDTSITAAVQYVTQHFGRLDVLVHNAGISGLNLPAPAATPTTTAVPAAATAAATNDSETIRNEFQLVLSTNVTGPAVVAAAFRPLLLQSANPYSIYVSSGARTLTRNAMQRTSENSNLKTSGAYQVSKAALNMLAVLEMRDFGISPSPSADEGEEEEENSRGIKVFAMSPGFVRSNLRGTSEEARSGWGKAGDPEESGRLLLSIVRGERDGDVGCFVHKNGVFPW